MNTYTCTRCHKAAVSHLHTWCHACRLKARASRKRNGGGGGRAQGGALRVFNLTSAASFPVASPGFYRDQAERQEQDARDALALADADAHEDAMLARDENVLLSIRL